MDKEVDEKKEEKQKQLNWLLHQYGGRAVLIVFFYKKELEEYLNS